MIHIKGLDNVVIRVQNIEAMIEFYCDVLGCIVEGSTYSVQCRTLRRTDHLGCFGLAPSPRIQ